MPKVQVYVRSKDFRALQEAGDNPREWVRSLVSAALREKLSIGPESPGVSALDDLGLSDGFEDLIPEPEEMP